LQQKAPRIREKNKTLAHIPPIKKNTATFLCAVKKSTFPTKTPQTCWHESPVIEQVEDIKGRRGRWGLPDSDKRANVRSGKESKGLF